MVNHASAAALFGAWPQEFWQGDGQAAISGELDYIDGCTNNDLMASLKTFGSKSCPFGGGYGYAKLWQVVSRSLKFET